jgi:phosphomevalonate kinase
MKIIGISGKKKSGKDTVASLLAANLPKGSAIRYHFADALKREVAIMYGVTVDFIESHKDAFRLILQGHGTDYKRNLYGHDYWVRKVEEALPQFERSGFKVLLIPDVRFFDEAEWVRKQGGSVIRVTKMYDDTTDKHPSEIELDDYKFDKVIENNGTLKDLLTKVLEIKV